MLKNLKLTLKRSAEMEGLFAPIVAAVIKLLEQQIESARIENGSQINVCYDFSACSQLTVHQRIVLVGGLGESSYLYDQIRAKFSREGIEVLPPHEPCVLDIEFRRQANLVADNLLLFVGRCFEDCMTWHQPPNEHVVIMVVISAWSFEKI